MAKQIRSRQRKKERNRTSTQNGQRPAPRAPGDIATAGAPARLNATTSGASRDGLCLLDRNPDAQFDELQAATDEEIDALRVNLVQDGIASRTADTAGHVVDDIAEEELARFTEAEPVQAGHGVASAEPGRDDTRRALRNQ